MGCAQSGDQPEEARRRLRGRGSILCSSHTVSVVSESGWATAGANLILIEPDLANLFPDSESVNRALRLLAETARMAMGSKRGRGR